ncbi:MAG: Flp pilus assembly complex ATPase component TadA, partial [Candidatus Brocadiae bacterium]|nr:Flp pilus assembly complex ATPase component TadA [Candidatus Brocadiia bacterium]
RSNMAGTGFEAMLVRLAKDVESGSAFSSALELRPHAFSRTVVAMARAGEAGGVLDVICQRIVEGIEDGSMPLPSVEPGGREMVRYWRALGRMLSSGVPVLESLRLVREEVVAGELAAATEQVEQAVLKGRSIAETMRELTDVFPEEMTMAVDLGEQYGNLDEQAFRIADAVESRDLSLLPLQDMDRLPPARKTANMLMLTAVQQHASDIHVEPTEDGRGRIRFRVDGVLHEFEWPDEVKQPPEVPYAELVSRIKVMAGMDIAEKRLPQDGRIELRVNGKPVDLRASTLPTVHGERVVMRVLFREALGLDLDSIGILEDDLAKVRQLCHVPHGLILCSGPTGSGKTTLFYAMLNHIGHEGLCLMSVEDPVEYLLEGVAQINVRPQIGLTFARAVRHILRQDPDIILIGEVRNTEVANLAMQCALTGHVVLTTLHAATAPGGIKRLVDMGVEPFVVNASLAGVISLRLVRILCSECKQEAEPPLHSLPSEAVEMVSRAEGTSFCAAKGCEHCNGTGYRGRTAIYEVLIPDDRVKDVVASGGDLASIREAAVAAGMRTMLGCGIQKAARGITSIQEVLRVVPHGPNE